MTNAPKHYTTDEGQQVVIPSRRQRRALWRYERRAMREHQKFNGVPRLESTEEWRASWQPLRGDL